MSGHRRSSLGPAWRALLALALVAVPALAEGAEPDPTRLATRGEALIDANCGDCQDGTREGLEQGLALLEEAVALDHPKPADIYRRLVDAYGQLALVYCQPDSAEQAAASERRMSYFRELMTLEPEDADLRYEYAMAVRDEAERRAALETALAIDPEHLDARFVLGQLDVGRGDADAGLRAMRAVYEQALADGVDAERVQAFGEWLIQALRGTGRDAEAWPIERQLRTLAEGDAETSQDPTNDEGGAR